MTILTDACRACPPIFFLPGLVFPQFRLSPTLVACPFPLESPACLGILIFSVARLNHSCSSSSVCFPPPEWDYLNDGGQACLRCGKTGRQHLAERIGLISTLFARILVSEAASLEYREGCVFRRCRLILGLEWN